MDPTKPQQPSNWDLIKADLAPIGRGIQRAFAPIQSAARGTAGPDYHDGGESDPNLNRRFDRAFGFGQYAAKPAAPQAAPAVPAPAGAPASPRVGLNGFGLSGVSLPN